MNNAFYITACLLKIVSYNIELFWFDIRIIKSLNKKNRGVTISRWGYEVTACPKIIIASPCFISSLS